MNKKVKWFLGASSVLLLAACGNNTAKQEEEVKKGDITQSKFPIKIDHEGTAISGGILKYAIVSDSPIEGVLNANYWLGAPDGEVVDFFDESLFGSDSDLHFTERIGKLTLDKEKKEVTVTIKKDVKWSDGHPLTIDDYIYSFEVIGHKDYTGARYGDDFSNIIGMEEYHKGETDKISGIKKVDDYTVTFKVKELSPSIIQSGGFWSSAMPKHIFSNIPIKDQAASDAVRVNPVGLGAFRVTKVVSGESVTLEANPYYWQGKPKIEGVVMEVVNTTNASDEFAKGNYDIMSVPTSTSIYDSFKELDNATIIGKWENTVNYVAFKLGKWDKEAEKIVTNPEAKAKDKVLRQAMGYALNSDAIASQFYGDLRARANTLITPTFSNLHSNIQKGYPYDVEKAKKLLDDAGYKDKDGDGFRETPKGEKLELKFASMSGGDGEAIAQAMIKDWETIGVKVSLVGGRTIEFNTFYKKIQEDDPEVDIFSGAWGLGGDPNQNGLWGDSSTNYARFVSEEQNKILKRMSSNEAFDPEKQKEIFEEWQKYSNDQAYAIPFLYRTGLLAVNKRVKNWDITIDTSLNTVTNLHKVELLNSAPVASKK
ncbi:oligopeptide ABC transporter substrate-binding protein [Carnobacteriaceae bacterium zg-84]|uniref:oligopeptide ABC transporter substrate-binding protein n=1 Tax=Granulicatella sp. zg-84 TaxID=2678503 RepID=UPI0013C28E73|nr:oligopeptide ABC transporter substrate-binding protein [Granulicatella sp. zg-84]NEW65823.1 oligopeptide ABC transporter substrate-binding protein [Granulicatella sp. zg-84]QMI86327.1 oligopeptide ABC transporter substrate-binding protein [Carnobacteriaceae bacterium zg-84]